jgi:hypothetical protein
VFQAGPAGHFQAFADAGFAEAPGAVQETLRGGRLVRQPLSGRSVPPRG